MILTSLSPYAQSDNNLKRVGVFSSGASFLSNGDLKGFYINSSIQKSFNKWVYSGNITTSIHDKEYNVFYQDNAGQTRDASIRNTVVGVQVGALLSRNLILREKESFLLGIGILVRYQTSSLYDRYFILYPSVTGLNNPVLLLDNFQSMRSLAIGGIIRMEYKYAFTPTWNLGGEVSFQIDTKSNILFNRGLCLGYTF